MLRTEYVYPNGERDTLLFNVKNGLTFASPYGNAVVPDEAIEPTKGA